LARVKIVSPLALPSKLIKFRAGGDETEPTQVTEWWARTRKPGDARATIAINTYYPELSSGYYRNGALLRLLQGCFRDIHCSLIYDENYAPDRICPDDTDGVLECDNAYVILREGTPVGAVLVWKLGVGGGSELIRDTIVLSVVCSAPLVGELFEAIERHCQEQSIKVVRV